MSDVHSLAAAYALNAIPESEVAAFRSHLRECETCRADVLEMQETAAVLAHTSAESPPPTLRDRVLAEVSRTPQAPAATDNEVVSLERKRGTAEPRAQQSGTTWGRRAVAGLAAACLLLAAALGVVTYQSNQRADEAQVVADELRTLVSDPATTVERAQLPSGGTGTLVVAGDGTRAVFVADDLAAPEAGETYQLWAIDESGAASLGLIPAGGDQTKTLQFPPGTSSFGMTVEPAGGSEQPSTEPVLLLKV